MQMDHLGAIQFMFKIKGRGKENGYQPNTSNLRGEAMIEYRDRRGKRFKVGDLVRHVYWPHKFFLILGFRWHSGEECYSYSCLHQQTGEKSFILSPYLYPAEEIDDNP